MGYRNLQECVRDLERHGHLIRCDAELSADLEVAEVHRRVVRAGGPAILFTRVKGCQFPMVSNLFGTIERARFLFRDTIESVRRVIELKIDPMNAMRRPLRYVRAPLTAWSMLPRLVRTGPVVQNETSVSKLPQLRSWPNDGGGFVTLPQVYSEDATAPGLMKSNLGMYRIQVSGNRYATDHEIGLHYQLHRGIGVHQTLAKQLDKPFRVNVFVGGTPSMTLAAVMPLPEGLSELTFAGALAGRRINMIASSRRYESDYQLPLPIYAEADFCIVGTVMENKMLPEGPFGDHLGYYSLTHDFPVLRVEKVYHRNDAIWPFTVVGRPPQEDSIFGQLIHDLTGPIIPTVIPGVHSVNAVDAAGVHPLLLAIGSERYTPYASTTRPQELLTQANAILGMGQMSLAKYLWIANRHDDPNLDTHDIERFLVHILQRVDWRRDLHFQTRTTIDTLDYSGGKLNEGSKLVVAAAGPKSRDLPTHVPGDLHLPVGFSNPCVCLPGVLAITGPRSDESPNAEDTGHYGCRIQTFCDGYTRRDAINQFPLVVIVDDSEFAATSLDNFLWVVFTRSNPAADAYGIESFTIEKHWGCEGTLVIDARTKPHHAPPLVEDPAISRRIDALATQGGPMAKWL